MNARDRLARVDGMNGIDAHGAPHIVLRVLVAVGQHGVLLGADDDVACEGGFVEELGEIPEVQAAGEDAAAHAGFDAGEAALGAAEGEEG